MSQPHRKGHYSKNIKTQKRISRGQRRAQKMFLKGFTNKPKKDNKQ